MISANLLVLRGLMDYKNYVQYAGTIAKLEDLDKDFKVLLRLIGDYYAKYGTDSPIPPEDLQAHFAVCYPSPDGMDLVKGTLKKLGDLDITQADILNQAMQRMVEKYFLNQIIQTAVPVLEDQAVSGVEEVEGLLAEYHRITSDLDEDSREFEPIQISEVLEYTEAEGLKWALPFLLDGLGPLRGAYLYHIFARPDSGKTSLCCHLAAHFAYQLRHTDECVLYLSNEEHIIRVRRRILCASLNRGPDELSTDEEAFQKEFLQKGGGRIATHGDCQSVVEVEKYISRYQPKVVFIDVGPKVQPLGITKTMSGPDRKHLTYKRFRELANQYDCAIITTGQADETATGKMFLNLNQMDGSKVGIPSELDAAIGIGVGMADTVRFFHICKNKIEGKYLKSPPYVIHQVTSRFTPQSEAQEATRT